MRYSHQAASVMDDAELANPVARSMPPSIYEVIRPDPEQSFRWHRHDYPASCARWNHHPEYELHLITRGEGRAMIGDHIGSFSSRQLALIGPDLPHAWFSTMVPGEKIEGRDVVLQFSATWIESLIALCPELNPLSAILETSRLGIEFTGPDTVHIGNALERMGILSGFDRMAACIELLGSLTRAPYRVLSIKAEARSSSHAQTTSMAAMIRMLMAADPATIRHERLAQELGLSASQFSRQFRAATGDTFMSFMHRLRISHACHLLATSEKSITEISDAAGFKNLSNFNRIFLRLRCTTPREYRRDTRKMTAAEGPNAPKIWH